MHRAMDENFKSHTRDLLQYSGCVIPSSETSSQSNFSRTNANVGTETPPRRRGRW